MKRALIIAAMFIIAISIGSCKKDIDLTATSGVKVDDYFKNQKDITAGLAGIYSAFQEEMTGAGTSADEGLGGRYNYWGDLRAETFFPSTFTNNNVISMATNTIDFGNSATDWSGLYKVVSRANLAIAYFPQVPAIDPSVTPQILNNSLAQAYAMRAEAYFYIVRLWGDAPMWTTPYLDITQSGSKAKTSAITLIDSVIIPDLTKAYTLTQKNQTPVVWNINEGAICAILADVYMWRAALPAGTSADYNNAITWYTNLFKAKSPAGTYYGGATQAAPSIAQLETGPNWKNNFLTPANSLETIWSIFWDYNDNGCACIPVFVQTSNNPVQLDPVFQAKFTKNYKTDIRVSKSIDTLTGLNHSNMLYKYYNLTPTAAGLTPNNANTLNYNVYLPMYRLADVYLELAEAYAQINDLANALKYLNFVYLRARNAAITPTAVGLAPSVYPTKATMIDGIIQEEQYELLGEGKRWFDLIRMGRVHQIMDPVLNIRNATSTTVGGVTTITPATTGFGDDRRFYWPISQSALNANKLLTQTPGY